MAPLFAKTNFSATCAAIAFLSFLSGGCWASEELTLQNDIFKNGENSTRSEKSRTLYDYQTHVVAYKDLTESKCLIEILTAKQSLIARKLANGQIDGLSKSFLTSNELSKRQIYTIAGHRITEFCRGFPTYLVEDLVSKRQNIADEDNYMLNDLPLDDNRKKKRKRRSLRRKKRDLIVNTINGDRKINQIKNTDETPKRNDATTSKRKRNENLGANKNNHKAKNTKDIPKSNVEIINIRLLFDEILVNQKTNTEVLNSPETIENLNIIKEEKRKRAITDYFEDSVNEPTAYLSQEINKNREVQKEISNTQEEANSNDFLNIDKIKELLQARQKRSNRHYFSGRVRGQTQSQYLNFGNSKEPGKAEAESTSNGTKAVVTGSSGIGQAQSQSVPVDCGECYPGYQDQTLQYGGAEVAPERLQKPSQGPETTPGGQTPGQRLPDSGYPGGIAGYPSGPGQRPFGVTPGFPGAQEPGQRPSADISGYPGVQLPGQRPYGQAPSYPAAQVPGQRPSGETPGYPSAQIPDQRPSGGSPQYPGPQIQGQRPGEIPGYPSAQIPAQTPSASRPGYPGGTYEHPGGVETLPGQTPSLPGQRPSGGVPGYPPGIPGTGGYGSGAPGQISSRVPGYPGRPETVEGPPSGVPGISTGRQIPGVPGSYPGQQIYSSGVPGEVAGQPAPGGTYAPPGQVFPGYPSQQIPSSGRPGVSGGSSYVIPGTGGYPSGGQPGGLLPGAIGGQIPGFYPGGQPGTGARIPGQTGVGPIQTTGDRDQGTFAGELSGRYASHAGQSGRFSGTFQGQYESEGAGSGVVGPSVGGGQLAGGYGGQGGQQPSTGYGFQPGIQRPGYVVQPSQPGYVTTGQIGSPGVGPYYGPGQTGVPSAGQPGPYAVPGTTVGLPTGDIPGYETRTPTLGQVGGVPGYPQGVPEYAGGVPGYPARVPSYPAGKSVIPGYPTGVQGPPTGEGGFSREAGGIPTYSGGVQGPTSIVPSYPGGVGGISGGQGVLTYPGGVQGPTQGPTSGVLGYPSGVGGIPGGQGTSTYPGSVQGPTSGISGYPSGVSGYPSGVAGIPGGQGTPAYPGGVQGATNIIPGYSGSIPGAQGIPAYPGGYPGGVGAVPAGAGYTGGVLGTPGYQSSIPGQVGTPGGTYGSGVQYGPTGGAGVQYGGTVGQLGVSGGVGTQLGGQTPETSGGIGSQGGVVPPGQYLQPGSVGGGVGGTQGGVGAVVGGADDADSQVQVSVQQSDNETLASAQAQGQYQGGKTQTQVSGTYSGSGSFSASAGSDDGNRSAQTQVSGGKEGAQSSAQGKGGAGQSQAQVSLDSETGDTMSSAQSSGIQHGTQTLVKASEKGGLSDAQADGPGKTSSQAQIGFTPYDETERDEQKSPFKGGGTAAAQGGTYSGMTQTQIQGKFRFGIKYSGAAQAASGTNALRNLTEPSGPFKPINFTYSPGRISPGPSQTQSQKTNLSSKRESSNREQTDLQTSETSKEEDKTSEQPNSPPPSDPKVTHENNSESPALAPEDYTESDYVDEEYQDEVPEEELNPGNPSRRNLESKTDRKPPVIIRDGSISTRQIQEKRPSESSRNYQENSRRHQEPSRTQQSLNFNQHKQTVVSQMSPNQRQHILLEPLDKLDATVHQSRGSYDEEREQVYQPGQIVPGGSGYQIPAGFRGKVKSIANGPHTYAIGGNSQAQSVTLSPGSGRIYYRQPAYAVTSKTVKSNGYYGSGYFYQPINSPVQHYKFKSGSPLPNFVSVSRSEAGQKDLYTGKKSPDISYTQSSSCGMFINTCVWTDGKKSCFPVRKTNPDGTFMSC